MKPTNLNKEFILSSLVLHQQELEGFGVKQVGLFGSFVRNEATTESDVDLLVEIQKENN